MILATALGTLAAFGLVRRRFVGRDLLLALILSHEAAHQQGADIVLTYHAKDAARWLK
jgi:ABC-type maltose transport system permease subunit